LITFTADVHLINTVLIHCTVQYRKIWQNTP